MVQRISNANGGALGQTPGSSRPELREHVPFKRILNSEIDARHGAQTNGFLKISGHADQRLRASGKPLLPGEIRQIEQAVKMAASKGSKDTLVLTDERAFIVNIPNRTVVTAIDSDRMKMNVFTNIDATVIVRSAGPLREPNLVE